MKTQRKLFLLGGFVCFSLFCYGNKKLKDPTLTEVWEPEPRIVSVQQNIFLPPSDAIVLFDGKNLNEWETLDGKNAQWEVSQTEKTFTVVAGKGDIQTKRKFGSIQLHLEWRSPQKVESEGQGRGNSGVFFQSLYEVQILDNYQNKTYSNGQAGSVYKQHIPLVNSSKPPGEWQVYDIIFMAPEFNEDGVKTRSAYITVFHNGVLIQNHVEVKGTTEYIGLPKNFKHGKMPLKLQDHSNPVSYRNIWVRTLD